ncbi:MAG: EAL domain-containing protein [Xanthomonadales bacterium]|nr:EAL domain-containing protein [Xanthomonadales bacterium]MBP7622650.1 EAL domain-containing protein [Xanthomonadales bacterium]
MTAVLLAETSTTRRRAMSSVLVGAGFTVQAMQNFSETLALLQRMPRTSSEIVACAVGWPDYGEPMADEVFDLLSRDQYEHLPVLVLADSSSPGAVNWMMKRPRSALLNWGDYNEAGEALQKLMRPTQPSAISLDATTHANMRVLLVDDSATVRLAFQKLLAKQGYQVEVASSVVEGKAKFAANPSDIVVTDYFMPGENGTELIRALKADSSSSSAICAVITGTYSDQVINDSLASGAIECMFKSEAKELFLARLHSLARMVSDRKMVDAERRRLQGILSSVGDGVYGVDRSGVIQFVNPAAVDLLGYADVSDLVGQSAYEKFHHAFENGAPMPRSACFLSQCYTQGSQVPNWQTVFISAARRPIPVECTVFPMNVDGVREGSVVAFRDVSQRRVLEEELRWQASHDSLTKLHNRAFFESQLEQEVSRLKRSEQTSLLLFIDVDRFKYINDTAGHSAGDQLLVEVSARLKSRLRQSDHLARMGGDEYAIILRNVTSMDIDSVSDEFRRALTSHPFVYAGKTYRITVSIGVAKMDKHTESSAEAMANADIACHLAKNGGRNQTHVFSQDSDQRASMDMELGWSTRLEEALRSDGFVLSYQPIVPLADFGDTPSNSGVKLEPYFEVLLRLRDSQGRLLAPDAFLPTAERFGMMLDIDRWVIHNALRALRETARQGRRVKLSLNLSAQSLINPATASFVTDKLVEFDVEARQLVFEITESRAVSNLESARALIGHLRALGCQFALDDFGVGFSTFSHLKHLDVDFLKIDGSFIQGLVDDKVDQAVVKAITGIAHSVGKLTVAEFVDRPQILPLLRDCAVDYIQGYFIGEPQVGLERALPFAQVGHQEGTPMREAS